MTYYISPPPVNPLARLLAGVFALLALAGAFFFGLIVLAVAVGVGMIAWIALWLRVWWLGRRGVGRTRPGASGGEVIEAEYTVVSRAEEDPP
jgi:hypothetical protein